jgi:hypothetical protein
MVGVFKSWSDTDTNGVVGRLSRDTLQTNAGGGTVRDEEFFHVLPVKGK